MDKFITIYKKEYVRGTRTYYTSIYEEDLDSINEDLKKHATPAVAPITFKDLSIVWNHEDDGEHLEAEIEVKNEWNTQPYKTTVCEFISDYLRDWIYESDPEDDLELDDWSDDDWSDDTTFEDKES